MPGALMVFAHITHLTRKVGRCVMSLFTTRRLRSRDVKGLAQDHTARKAHSPDLIVV